MKSVFIQPLSDEELEKVIRYNIGRSSQIRAEIRELDTVQIQQSVTKKDKANEVLETLEETQEENEEYLYYYLNLRDDLKSKDSNLPESLLREIVIDNLPSIENKNYSNIVNRIKLEILKDISGLEELKQGEEEDFIREIEQEQNQQKTILKIISSNQPADIEEIIEKSSKKENQLIFLRTPRGSIYAENDLYSIKDEYYDSFKELILSIQNGTFKNVERFKNNQVINGISKVKAFKTRVIFDRVGKDKYVIIQLFVKKTNNDKGYQELIKTRIDYYKKNRSLILEQLDNEDYIEENKRIADSIIKGLEEKNLVKTLKAGGDNFEK